MALSISSVRLFEQTKNNYGSRCETSSNKTLFVHFFVYFSQLEWNNERAGDKKNPVKFFEALPKLSNLSKQQLIKYLFNADVLLSLNNIGQFHGKICRNENFPLKLANALQFNICIISIK